MEQHIVKKKNRNTDQTNRRKKNDFISENKQI